MMKPRNRERNPVSNRVKRSRPRMTIKTKSIYDESDASDGIRVLVSRYYPRGVRRSRFDLWIREASPDKKLLKEYRSGLINWKEFSKKFRIQLRSQKESKAAIDELMNLSKGDLTLLCYEKEGENCHRNIVKSKMEKLLRGRSNLSCDIKLFRK